MGSAEEQVSPKTPYSFMVFRKPVSFGYGFWQGVGCVGSGDMLDNSIKPSFIVNYLDQYLIGQEDAKRTVAVAVYSHFKKIARSQRDNTRIEKSNVLLIGSSGTGKTLLCETLSRVLGVPFVTAEATSLAQTRYVNEEIEAVLQRLVDKAAGDISRAQNGIVYIDEIDKLKATDSTRQSSSGESVQHALLKIMEGTAVRLSNTQYLDTTNVLFICGGAFVGLNEIMSQTHGYGFIAMSKGDNQKILDRLNSRVKPTDLFAYGLIPEFTGRLPIVAHFGDLTRKMLVRVMTEPKNSIYAQFREIFHNEGVELTVEPLVFEQISEVAFEYKTGARSLRGIFEELVTPILYVVPDQPNIQRVIITSLFSEPTFVRKPQAL
jgi:ATP-dependent Clp protease ATP-binding subunit ClpX